MRGWARRVLIAVAGVGLLAGLAAQAAFRDDFDDLVAGELLIEQDGVYQTTVGDPPPGSGMIVMGEGPTGQATKVLEHKGDAQGYLTRLRPGSYHPVAGMVRASIDVQFVAGQQLILFFDSVSPRIDAGAFILIEDLGPDRQEAVVRAMGEPAQNVAPLDYGGRKWYRLVATMHLDPDDGERSTYDLEVIDLAEGKTVGRVEGVNCPGAPTQILGTQVQSARVGDRPVEVRFDHWSYKAVEAAP